LLVAGAEAGVTEVELDERKLVWQRAQPAVGVNALPDLALALRVVAERERDGRLHRATRFEVACARRAEVIACEIASGAPALDLACTRKLNGRLRLREGTEHLNKLIQVE